MRLLTIFVYCCVIAYCIALDVENPNPLPECQMKNVPIKNPEYCQVTTSTNFCPTKKCRIKITKGFLATDPPSEVDLIGGIYEAVDECEVYNKRCSLWVKDCTCQARVKMIWRKAKIQTKISREPAERYVRIRIPDGCICAKKIVILDDKIFKFPN
uniref:uncharacterized protein LOC120334518 n=1 Tax=Styela clava TaxID=7725 RepID=UPI00193970C1|nr:uncharacterized protein LOC120334518 [Styela clava]